MTNEVVISLKMKQSEDDSKKSYCIKSFDEAEPTPFPRSKRKQDVTEKFDRHVEGSESEARMK